jgi:hypothetical protein
MITKKINMKLERYEMNDIRATGVTIPSGLTVELFNLIRKGQFNGEIVITGVPTDSDGQPIWSNMDDLIRKPHSHGLVEAIGAISQIMKITDTYLVFKDRSIPEVKIRFEANIKDIFKPDSKLHNPTAWIHVGHGMLEHGYELLEDLEDWEDEEFEPIPGISNGHEDDDFVSARWLRDTIFEMDGDILFMALPLCYGKQIAETLIESESIHCSHAPYSFSVSETLEFYDCDENGILPEHTLTAWRLWVRGFETVWRSAIINHFGKMSEK